MATKRRPNFLIVLIDDLRFDELGICGHPYMKTPNIDRLGHEGAMFTAAFHTTPLCSPNRASILTGQYASRHGIIDNVARDAHSHRLPNYHVVLQKLGYETAHVGKWHMGNSGGPRPGYHRWVSFPGHGSIMNPVLNIDGEERQHQGYITDLLNTHAVEFLRRSGTSPSRCSLRTRQCIPTPTRRPTARSTSRTAATCPRRVMPISTGANISRAGPTRVPAAEVVKQKPAWKEAHELRVNEVSRKLLDGIQAGSEEEIRLRAAMMASVDEGMAEVFKALEETGQLDNTFILFLGDNGYFFGEHGLGPERRFAYEEGIKSPFLVRYPAWFKPGTVKEDLVAGARHRAHGARSRRRQGGRHRGMCKGCRCGRSPKDSKRGKWRTSFMCEYFSENAMPWLIGMSYKAIRTARHKYIHWTQKSLDGVACDELYDLKNDPYEMKNLVGQRGSRPADQAFAQTTFRAGRAVGGTMKRRTLLAGSLALPMAAQAQQWPSRTIRMIVPYAPGATGDIGGRLYGDELSKSLGQSVVIDNKTGAGGTIAMAEARARSGGRLHAGGRGAGHADLQPRPLQEPGIRPVQGHGPAVGQLLGRQRHDRPSLEPGEDRG